MFLRPEIDEERHCLWLKRVWKKNGQVYETIFAVVKLTAQAETLIKRSMEADTMEDSDCWLLAVGTEFSDPNYASREYLEL